MAKRYDQYCPMAHALDLVGERWALLVVRELMHGPKRYTDLVGGLPGIGTNILAARLRDLEAGGRRRQAHAAAAGRVEGLRAHRLRARAAPGDARAGPLGRALARPPDVRRRPVRRAGVANALDIVLAPLAPAGRFEFRVGDEVASLVDGEVLPEAVDDPDVVIEGDAGGIYDMFVNQCLDRVTVTGDVELLERLLEVVPPRAFEAVSV